MENAQTERSEPPPPAQAKWPIVVLVCCVIGAVSELVWGEEILNWVEQGRLARRRTEVIASYLHAVETDGLPRPADTNAIAVYHLDKGAPYRMGVRVRTVSGETRHFQLVRAPEDRGTNWTFRAD